MIRKTSHEIGKVDLIITADWHLREDTPICRTDDFWATQWKKVDFVSQLQKKYDCPIFHAGDLFHHWKPSPNLLRETMKHLPKQFYMVYGNHDLPQHSLELREKSGIATLEESGYLIAFTKGSWLQKPYYFELADKMIGVLHIFTYDGKALWPGCTAKLAKELLDEHEVHLLITGDNHTPFVVRSGEKLLVNPGSLMRQDADQIDYKPAVWLWRARYNNVLPIYLPIDENAVTREHIDKVEQKNEMLESFISGLDKDWDISLSFRQNLSRYAEANEVPEKIMKIIYKLID